MRIVVEKNVTNTFIKNVDMENLMRDNKKQTWLSSSTILKQYRRIKAINGNSITLDITLSDSLDSSMFDNMVIKDYSIKNLLYNIGIENLTLSTDTYKGELFDANGNLAGVTFCNMNNLQDCWITGCVFQEFNSGIMISNTVSRVTLSYLNFSRSYGNKTGAKAFDISLDGTQILITRCSSVGFYNFSVGTMTNTSGPNVIYQYIQSDTVSMQPHMRWASGLLIESVVGGDISVVNRGTAGSGQGWAIVNCVLWNCVPKSLTIQQPPGYYNFAIGCIAPINKSSFISSGPAGTIESEGSNISYSLFTNLLQKNNIKVTLGN
jgi:hypothetical protein